MKQECIFCPVIKSGKPDDCNTISLDMYTRCEIIKALKAGKKVTRADVENACVDYKEWEAKKHS